MAARDEADRKAEARAFADQVDVLVSATLRGEPLPANASEDAVRLAAAFLLLDRLVGQYVMASGPAISTAEGAHAAHVMLLSLRSGYDHPVWTYITGVRSKYRLNRKASRAELHQRAYSVGLMSALKDQGSGDRAAAKALSEHDYYRSRNVTLAALRKWPAELQEPAARELADLWYQKLMATWKDADDAMRRTITALETLQAVDQLPSLAAAAHKRPMYAKLVDKAGRSVGEIEVSAKK